ncbi:hypothetical protein SynBIOSE41_03111 [Synechococcus sp. BIOS-E4-1]|nr:hypothetical protein SynBIOSE41_03111 [Synechococcus sp. BIOS-E4-1]
MTANRSAEQEGCIKTDGSGGSLLVQDQVTIFHSRNTLQRVE